MPDQELPPYGEPSNYTQPIGDPSKMRPGFTGNEDLESMYVQSSPEKDNQIKMRAHMNQPGRGQGLSGCGMMMVILLVLLGIVAGYLAISKTETVNEDGVPIETSKLKYYISFFSRNDRIRKLEGMEPQRRAYFLTHERVELIYARAAAYFTVGDKVPSITEMVELGLIREAQVNDGWGTPISLQATDRIRVVSSGADRNPHSGDDISIDGGRWGIPLMYQTIESGGP